MEKNNYDFCIVITTYNREEELKKLLNDIFLNNPYNILVLVFDDGSDKIYDLSDYNLKYIKFLNNHGKKKFWIMVNKIFNYCKNIKSEYFVFLQDDQRISDFFLKKSMEKFENIIDPKKISLELRTDSRTTRSNWTNFEPIPIGDYIKTQWVELDFICKYDFFKTLNFTVDPINESRWKKNPNLSTGVGHQLSTRLNKMGFSMYHVKNSLISHGMLESKLFYELRKKEKLISKIDNNG